MVDLYLARECYAYLHIPAQTVVSRSAWCQYQT
jgi:hypothetical protein